MSSIKEQIENCVDYNDEPVYYCKQCLSLRIRHILDVANTEFCDSCGSMDIDTCNIYDWEDLYKNRYGFYYLNNSY